MTYTQYVQLTTVEQNEKKDIISFSTLEKALLNRPTSMVYCISEGELYGVISMGDISRASRAGIDYVKINTKFTRVLPSEYMMARKIFCEKKNISALPVVDENNKLLGAYTRWDDLCFRKAFSVTEELETYLKSCQCVVLVKPCELFKEKYKLFRKIYDYLSVFLGGTVKIAVYSEVVDFIDKAELVLFASEDELRGVETLIRDILHRDLKQKFKTYRTWFHELKFETVMAAYLRNIKQHGIHILNLRFEWDSDYSNILQKKIIDKFSAFGEKAGDKMLPGMYPHFFDDLYTKEYADSIMHLPFSVETGSYNGKLKDHKSALYNVINGERFTVGQPQKYNKTVYFVGPCFIYGHYVEDKNTIESLLQKHINDKGQMVKVVNCGSLYNNALDLELARIKEISLKKGDCVVIYIDDQSLPDICELDLMEVLEEYNVGADWLVNAPSHCNHKINALYAEAIYDRLAPVLTEEVGGAVESIKMDEDFVKTIYIDRYFADFNALKYDKIGAIVMNCNPFTYGHRYLIEEALKTVDFLIIFVVEENESLFSFDERFAMVYDGTRDLRNVMVVPSGPFILAKTTFPEYFVKEADEDIVKNVENDITLFAERIAPRLNITFRFVGEEPEDMVTNEYNLAMKKILPQHGIELVEIARKQLNGCYISASRVRKYLTDYDMGKLSEMLPDTTWKILFEKECSLV